MFLLLLSFLQILSATDSSLHQQSKLQADFYINQIEKEKDIEENLWALTTVTAYDNKIKDYVEKEVDNSQRNNFLTAFKRIEENYESQLQKVVFETGSSNLLTALLLSIEEKSKKKNIYTRFQSKFEHPDISEIDFKSFFKSVIESKEITKEVLANNKFLLPHFFLLYYDSSNLLPRNYLEDLSSNISVSKSSDEDLYDIIYNTSLLRIHYLLDQYSKTEPLYNRLIQNEVFPNSILKLRLYRYLDYSMYRLGYFDRSLQIVREFTLPLSDYFNQEETLIQIQQLQGVYLYSIGKIKSAKEIYKDVLAKINRQNLNLTRSSLYNNLALAHFRLGEYEKYLDLQLQALETAKETDNFSHQLNVYNNLFIYYKETNDLDNALAYLQKAKELAKSNNENDELGKIHTLHGSFYRNFEEDYAIAHKFYSKAEDILNPENNSKYYFDLLKEQAETYLKQDSLTKALQKHDQLIKLSSDKNNPDYIYALVHKALINLKVDKVEESKELIKEFKSLPLDQLSFPQLIKAKTVEADYLQRTGKYQEALTLLEPALEQIVERAKSSADLESGFWHVEDEYLDAFELTVSIYRQTGQNGKAIQTLDQLKTINDASLYQNPLVKSSLLNESELTEYKRLTDQLDATRKKLLTAPEDEQFNIRQTINELKLKKRRLDQKLTNQIDSDPTSIREIQNHLSARELVLHITELNDQFYIANISRSDVSINTIPIDSTLSNLLSSSVQQVATNETNLDSLYKISQIINLGEIPDYIEQVTLIPDSDFYQLPIDILPLDKPSHSYSYGDVTYAIEKFTTQYLTSLEDFIAKPSEKAQPSNNPINYTGYGVSNFDGYNNQSLVSLPFARTEVSDIANRLTQLSNVQTFVNEQSTKSTFKQTAPKSQIIHLATHSEVSERDPMFSTIYMSSITSSEDSTFDGQIFAYELFELNLNNEMIMLNSCESGSGSFIQGTGVMGISRALRYAGANSLVLNLWSVNDMLASDFAIHFYDQLNKGKSKAEALRDTKRYFLNSKNASPHFWGPYMLIGNPDSIVEPNQTKNMAMAGTFITYFLLIVSLSYLTQHGFIFRSEDRKAA